MPQQTLVFLGPQGSGKGTQVGLLKEFLQEKDPSRKVTLFEAGKRLREFGTEGGYIQDIVDASLKRGELQPDFITLYLMSKFFFEELRGNEHLFVDGFPRTLEQQAIFHGAMHYYKREKPAVVFLAISDEEAVKRLRTRGRSDDSEENIRKRLAWSRAQVLPAVEWFRASADYRFVEVNGEQPVEDTHREILQKLGLQ